MNPTVLKQSQAEAFATAKIFLSGNAAHNGLLVTGTAGVGKSILLSWLYRLLSTDYLRDSTRYPFPISLPCPQLDSHATSRAHRGELLDVMLELWATQCGIRDMDPLPSRWLEEQSRRGNVVVLWDGIDEFLSRNPSIGIKRVASALDYARSLALAPHRVRTILGVRVGQAGLSLLVRDAIVIEIRRPTQEEALQAFPEIGQLLGQDLPPRVADLILTPLVLYRLGPVAKGLRIDTLTTGASVVELALREVLNSRSKALKPNRARLYSEADACIEALALIAYCAYQAGYSTLEYQSMAAAGEQLRQQWKKLDDLSPSDRVLHRTAHARIRSKAAFESVMLTVCRSTTSSLQSAGSTAWEFEHRLWHDYLVARYVARCVRSKFLDGMAQAAFIPDIHMMSGEVLGAWTITPEIIDRAFAPGVSAFVGGNLMALAAASPRTRLMIQPDAFAKILLALFRPETDPFVRQIIINGFNPYGQVVPIDAAKATASSQYALHFKGAMLKAVQSLTDPLAKSLAACILLEASPADPEINSQLIRDCILTGSNAEEQVVLDSVCNWRGARADSAVRTLQLTIVGLVRMFLQMSNGRGAATVHYLYYLAVLAKHNRLVSEAATELDDFLRPGSSVEMSLQSRGWPPGTSRLFELCRKLIGVATRTRD